MNGTVQCPICGRPYKWYAWTTIDQSACPKCVREAEGTDRPLRERLTWK